MKTRIFIAGAAFALAAILILFFFWRGGLSVVPSRRIKDHGLPLSPAMNSTPALEGRSVVSSLDALGQPEFKELIWIQDLLAGSDPTEMSQLDQALKLLDERLFIESRIALIDLVRKRRNKIQSAAYLAIAVSFYREGNLRVAADQFESYLIFRGNDREFPAFAEAAQINIAVIQMKLMQTAADDRSRIAAAKAAIKAINAYLERWPQGSQAWAARIALVKLQGVLDGQR